MKTYVIEQWFAPRERSVDIPTHIYPDTGAHYFAL
jgi:hypothetical protein